MAAVESAVYNLLGVFHKHSAEEGDNLKLNRSELSTLLASELPCCYRVSIAVLTCGVAFMNYRISIIALQAEPSLDTEDIT